MAEDSKEVFNIAKPNNEETERRKRKMTERGEKRAKLWLVVGIVVALLCTISLIGLPIYGYIYDCRTGRLIEVPEATEAGKAS